MHSTVFRSKSSSPRSIHTRYDRLGRATSIIQEIAGLTPAVVMSQQYSLLSSRSQLSTALGGTADFQNTYTFDDYGRTASITQSGVTGGNAVAEKRVDFAYDSVNQFTTITRYNNLTGTETVANSSYTFDLAGRLTGLTHAKGSTTLADHHWTFDAGNRMTQCVNAADGTADYTNDAAGQLTGADYTYSPTVADELYVYDSNGNRTNDGFSVGTNNRLLTDDTYRHEYDAEGNRILRYVDADSSGALNTGDTDITVYTWDYRNRLTKVTHYADYSHYVSQEPGEVVEYAYDYQNRWVRKMLDSDGDGTANSSAIFVYDENQIVMQFDNTGEGDAACADLSHRYAWRAGVDQLLADEQVSSLNTAGSVLWPLGDHINTVRELASYDDATDTTTVSNHRVYHAFGEVVSETNSAVTCLFNFTARPFDKDAGLQNNLNRWYDPTVGRWMSEDPIESDRNLYRYVGNNPVLYVDPTGLWWPQLGIPCFETQMGDAEIHPDCANGSCGTGVPGIPLNQLFFKPAELTDNLGAWMQVEVHSTDLCADGKPGEITVDLTFRWVNYMPNQHKTKKYKVTVDGQPITISEGNTTKKVTPVEPPEDWPWPKPLDKIKVKQWYAWTGSYTKKMPMCPENGDGSVEIRVAVDYHPPGVPDMVETAKVDWSYGCTKKGSTCCATKRPFTCKVTETSYASWGAQKF